MKHEALKLLLLSTGAATAIFVVFMVTRNPAKPDDSASPDMPVTAAIGNLALGLGSLL